LECLNDEHTSKALSGSDSADSEGRTQEIDVNRQRSPASEQEIAGDGTCSIARKTHKKGEDLNKRDW
jgi:hypothetical protein